MKYYRLIIVTVSKYCTELNFLSKNTVRSFWCQKYTWCDTCGYLVKLWTFLSLKCLIKATLTIDATGVQELSQDFIWTGHVKIQDWKVWVEFSLELPLSAVRSYCHIMYWKIDINLSFVSCCSLERESAPMCGINSCEKLKEA